MVIAIDVPAGLARPANLPTTQNMLAMPLLMPVIRSHFAANQICAFRLEYFRRKDHVMFTNNISEIFSTHTADWSQKPSLRNGTISSISLSEQYIKC